jgi:hypothetical protein
MADGHSVPAAALKPDASAAQRQGASAEAAVEAEEDRKLLAQREAELDAEKEANLKLQKSLSFLFPDTILNLHAEVVYLSDWKSCRTSQHMQEVAMTPPFCLISFLCCCRELHTLQETIARETLVPQSQMFQQVQRQLHAAREEVERQRQTIVMLQQERAGMQRRQANQELQVCHDYYHYTLLQ